jgi:hypothetical protein
VLVTLTVTDPDTVDPAAGETIVSGPGVGVAVGVGVGVGVAVGVGVGVGLGVPLLTIIETEAVASTVPVVC